MPQMRQSEGNRTEKRLSAAWLAQDDGLRKTTGCCASLSLAVLALAVLALALLARIWSSLLLKTASSTSPPA